jgi:hypothetical protein
VELGLGARDALAVPGTGRVVSVFPKAAYLQLPAGLVALASLEVPSGPGHARSRIALDRLRAGDPVVVTAALLQAGPVLLDLSRPQIWRGAVPTAAELAAGRNLLLDLLGAAPPSSLDDALRPTVEEQVRRGDVRSVADRLGGAGPGLTPAGDDCLSGILLIARIRWGKGAERELVEAAAGVRTNDIALMFLTWAARGQSIEPVHRLLLAAVRGDVERARQALRSLVGFGHSSGADLALGLGMGLRLLPPAPVSSCPWLPSAGG